MLTQDSLIHATTRELWEAQSASGTYVPPGFEGEGFIHCCHRGQLDRVLRDYFGNAETVTLLIIDATRVVPEIKYEVSPTTGDDYPHIYGPLDVSAVIEAIDVVRDSPTWATPTDL